MKTLLILRNQIVKIVEVIDGIFLLSMVLVVFLGVLDRFWLHICLPWPEELARLQLICISFLSAALAITKKKHYVVDYFYKKIFKHSYKRIELLASLITWIVILILFFKTSELITKVWWQHTSALKVSMGCVYGSIAVSLLLLLIFCTVEIIEIFFYNKER